MNASDSDILLNTYDCLSATTGHMLSAAQSGDWERLVTLERDCSSIVARLSALETEDPLPTRIRDRKAALIRKVLADDAAIRDITEPQLKRLSRLLDANRSEQRLLRAYGPPPVE